MAVKACGVKLGDDGGGGIDGPDGWHPAGLSMHLPLLSSPRLIKSRMTTDCCNMFQVCVGECLFWYRPTWVVPDKGP